MMPPFEIYQSELRLTARDAVREALAGRAVSVELARNHPDGAVLATTTRRPPSVTVYLENCWESAGRDERVFLETVRDAVLSGLECVA